MARSSLKEQGATVSCPNAVDLDAVHDDLAGVVRQALEPAHISVWVSRRT